ncbi:MAG TPA: FadR/GntR family transcriptional regulator [Streptosporangiaceae bacterium]|nr:FadR/GntR family transcriptional regulator [Streptosporangiaceae bacterium]
MAEAKSGSVVDEAISYLKARIENGQLAPGMQLPPEAVLAREMQLSRLSLREAVRALAMAGVLEVRRGAGTFVTDLRPDKLVRIVADFMDLAHDSGVGELFECRYVIEPGATALAATRITDEQLTRLYERIQGMSTMTDPEELVADDLALHAAIVAATGNRTLQSLADTVAQRTARARIWRAGVKQDVVPWTFQQHMSIYEALRARDSLGAYAAASRHIADVEAWVRQRLVEPRDAGGEPSAPWRARDHIEQAG